MPPVRILVNNRKVAEGFYRGLGLDDVDGVLRSIDKLDKVGPDAVGELLVGEAAATPEQAAAIGNQAAGRVFLFLATDDFDRDHATFTAAGVRFVRPPAVTPYGKVAVFEDLYGNRWDLIEHTR